MAQFLRKALYRIDILHAHPLFAAYDIGITAGGERWVSLNGKVARLPGDMAKKHEDAEFAFRHCNGVLTALDLAEPYWYNGSNVSVSCIPDYRLHALNTGVTASSWIFSSLENVERFYDPMIPDALSCQVLRTIRQDFIDAYAMLQLLDGIAGIRAINYNPPFFVPTLYFLESKSSIQLALSAARFGMLQLIGAISYAYRFASDLLCAVVNDHYSARILEWMIGTGPVLGLCIDFRSEASFNIPLRSLLEQGIPIYYPFDEQYRPPNHSPDTINAHIPFETSEARAAFDNALNCLPALQSNLARGAGALSRPLDTRGSNHGPINDLAGFVRAWLMPALFLNAPAIFNERIVWHAYVLREALLVMPQLVEAKLRAFALTYHITDIEDVLTEAVHRGMEFTLFYPLKSIPSPSLSPFHPPPPYLMPNIQDNALPYHGNCRTAYHSYENRIPELLSRPHAVRFVTMGGIMARLARLYSNDILGRVVQGPSRTVIEYRHGEVASRTAIADCVSPEEIDVLLGRSYAANGSCNHYWWPRPADFVAAGFDPGEWTARHEGWFRKRLQLVHAGKAGPMESFGWTLELSSETRSIHRGRYQRPEAERLRRTCEGLEAYNGKWNGMAVSRIKFN